MGTGRPPLRRSTQGDCSTRTLRTVITTSLTTVAAEYTVTFTCCFDKSCGAYAPLEGMKLTGDRVHHTHNDGNLPVRKTHGSVKLADNESSAPGAENVGHVR